MLWVSWIQWGWILLFFLFATWQDLRTYHISDWIWVIGGVGSTILHLMAIYHVLLYSWLLVYVSFGITLLCCGFVWVLNRVTKISFFGFADYLALLFFSYTIPYYIPILLYNSVIRAGISPLIDLVCSSTIILILFLLGNFLKNVGGIIKTPSKLRKNHWFGEFHELSWISISRFLLIGHRIPISQLSKETKAVCMELYDEISEKWVMKPTFQTIQESPYAIEQRWAKFFETTHDHKLERVWIAPYIPFMSIFFLSSLMTVLFGNWYWQLWFS